MTEIIIRPIERDDFDTWKTLWQAYLDFYKDHVSDEVTRNTFSRFFLDGEYEPKCLVAEQNEKIIGFVHFLNHRHTWRLGNVCYLQDLYAEEAVRGTGIGRKLIEAVYARADTANCENVYWMTQDFNTNARKLYDRIGDLTPFIKYQR